MLKVVCSKTTRKNITAKFDVSPSLVSNAFNYHRFCEQHSRIRCYAINFLNASVVEV